MRSGRPWESGRPEPQRRLAMRLVLASNNPGKLGELQALFAPLGVQLVAQGHLGIVEAEEPHITFVENALAKARHAAAAAGEPAIADDSGLVVDALGGAPGVASAHFADVGPASADREAHRRAQDAANNALLLQRLGKRADRAARFVSTLVAVRSASDPEPLIAVGRWEADIAHVARGAGGFGYDPLVFIASLGKSVAELDAAAKNAVSHRALAARQMLALMRDVWRLGVMPSLAQRSGWALGLRRIAGRRRIGATVRSVALMSPGESQVWLSPPPLLRSTERPIAPIPQRVSCSFFSRATRLGRERRVGDAAK